MSETTKTTCSRGQRWTRCGRVARVLAVLDGYVVFRFPRAPVAAMHHSDFQRNFQLIRKGER